MSQTQKIKLVVDHRRKIYATFIVEEYEDEYEYIYIDPEEITKIADEIKRLMGKHYRPAKGSEIDDLAYEKLGALPVEE
jgi:hypothetical protein